MYITLLRVFCLMVFTMSRYSEYLVGILYCCLGRIPRLSLIRHSLYVGVIEKLPPPPLTGEQCGKMEPKYPEGAHCQGVLRPQGGFSVPVYFK